MLEQDQRLTAAVVLQGHTLGRPIRTDKELVLTELAEAQHGGSGHIMVLNAPVALHDDEAVGGFIVYSDRLTGQDSQLPSGKETGYTPLQRLSLARIEHAKRLLHLRSRSGLSIQEIAWMCGFRDSLYFSRIFRRTTGTAPKDWI